MDKLAELLDTKRVLLKTKQKIINNAKDAKQTNYLFVINVTLDSLEKQIAQAKLDMDKVTYH